MSGRQDAARDCLSDADIIRRIRARAQSAPPRMPPRKRGMHTKPTSERHSLRAALRRSVCNIPAPGEPELARRIADDLQAAGFPARAVDKRGFDHGVWVPLKLAYPDADIPVVSVSVDPNQGPEHHYRLGQALAGLGGEGVLVIGSGSFTHNLGEAFKLLRAGSARPMCPMGAGIHRLDEPAAGSQRCRGADRLPPAKLPSPAEPSHRRAPAAALCGHGCRCAGEGARASRVHDSAEFGVLAMTMWRFDPAGTQRQPEPGGCRESARGYMVAKNRRGSARGVGATIGMRPVLNDFQALRVG
jgi:hypothetical protein